MIKTLHYHAKGTATAAKHGFGKTGCYTVETRETGRPLRVEAAFLDPEAAALRLAQTPGLLCHYYKSAAGNSKRNGPSWLND